MPAREDSADGAGTTKSATTQRKLLDAGARVFANVGYRDAGIREICKEAGVNQASVNYHFGSKIELYSAVLQHAFDEAQPAWPMPLFEDAPENPERQLRSWVRWFMKQMIGDNLAGQLISAEMVSPTPAFDDLIDRSMHPIWTEVTKMVGALLGADPGSDAVRMSTSSIFGQCVPYRNCHHVVDRLDAMPDAKSEDELADRLADHIATFTLAGIRAQASHRKPS